MRIIVPLVLDGTAIRLPGNPDLWSNADPAGNKLIGDYDGEPDFPYEPVVPAYDTAKLTHYEFYKRFPPEKYLALLRMTEPASPTYDAEIEYSLRILQAARFVDLAFPEVISGVQLLVSKSVITEADANKVLTPYLLPGETGA